MARTRGRLVQLFIASCEPPLFFGERQGLDFKGWNGSPREPEAERLKQALNQVIAGTAAASPSPSTTTNRFPRPSAIFPLLAVLILLGAGAWWARGWRSTAGPARIAVQPIEPLNGGGNATSFADGLTDQITASLNDGRVPTITRADSQNLKSGDIDTKLRALGADYSINGTVELSSGMLRARLHLDDHSHHTSLWSYETTGSVTDAPAFNFAVGQAVAGVLSCVYRGLGSTGLTDTELLSRYVRVCDLFVNHDDASDSKSTFELLGNLRQITTKAPDFSPAQSDLAKFGAYLAPLLPPDQAASVRQESARHATLALALDPHSADAWLAREMLRSPTDWAGRETLLRKGVAANPDWPHTNGFLGKFLMETGRMREAATYGQRAAAADLQIDWRPYGAQIACEAGRADSVISDLQQQLATSAADPTIKWSLRWCLLAAGRYSEAQKLTNPPQPGPPSLYSYEKAAIDALASGATADRSRAQSMIGKFDLDNSNLPVAVKLSAALGDLDTAFQLTDRFSPGYPMTGDTSFLFSPMTLQMRRDRRFLPLMMRFGLLQFWRSTGRWPDFCQGAEAALCKATFTRGGARSRLNAE